MTTEGRLGSPSRALITREKEASVDGGIIERGFPVAQGIHHLGAGGQVCYSQRVKEAFIEQYIRRGMLRSAYPPAFFCSRGNAGYAMLDDPGRRISEIGPSHYRTDWSHLHVSPIFNPRPVCPLIAPPAQSLCSSKSGTTQSSQEKENASKGTEKVKRLIPLNVRHYKDVLEHWHKGVLGVCVPLKKMKISKKRNRRDYNLWHRRRALALVHEALGKDEFLTRVVTTKEGKERSFSEISAYCIKHLKSILLEKKVATG